MKVEAMSYSENQHCKRYLDTEGGESGHKYHCACRSKDGPNNDGLVSARWKLHSRCSRWRDMPCDGAEPMGI